MGPPSLTSFMKFALAVCALLIDNQTNGTETVPLPLGAQEAQRNRWSYRGHHMLPRREGAQARLRSLTVETVPGNFAV